MADAPVAARSAEPPFPAAATGKPGAVHPPAPPVPPVPPAPSAADAFVAAPAVAAPPPPASLAPVVATPSRAPDAEAKPPPAPGHLLASALDPGPVPLADPEFAFPPEAGLHDGVVKVRLLIDETGAVTDVAVLRAQPKGLFEAAAVAGFLATRFAPGRLAGQPVKSQLTAEVEFKPYNRGANVSGRSY